MQNDLKYGKMMQNDFKYGKISGINGYFAGEKMIIIAPAAPKIFPGGKGNSHIF